MMGEEDKKTHKMCIVCHLLVREWKGNILSWGCLYIILYLWNTLAQSFLKVETPSLSKFCIPMHIFWVSKNNILIKKPCEKYTKPVESGSSFCTYVSQRWTSYLLSVLELETSPDKSGIWFSICSFVYPRYSKYNFDAVLCLLCSTPQKTSQWRKTAV